MFHEIFRSSDVLAADGESDKLFRLAKVVLQIGLEADPVAGFDFFLSLNRGGCLGRKEVQACRIVFPQAQKIIPVLFRYSPGN